MAEEVVVVESSTPPCTEAESEKGAFGFWWGWGLKLKILQKRFFFKVDIYVGCFM